MHHCREVFCSVPQAQGAAGESTLHGRTPEGAPLVRKEEGEGRERGEDVGEVVADYFSRLRRIHSCEVCAGREQRRRKGRRGGRRGTYDVEALVRSPVPLYV